MTRFVRIALAASATLATMVAAMPSTAAAIVHHPRHGQGPGVGNLGWSSSNWNGTWTITIKDVTTGGSFSTVQSYSGPQTSAEWIEEAPTVGGRIAPLA